MGRNQIKVFPQTVLLSSAKVCISVFPDLFMYFCSEQPWLGTGRMRSVFSSQVSSWVYFALRKREGEKTRRIKQGDALFFFLSGIKPDVANLPLIKQYFTFRKRQLNIALSNMGLLYYQKWQNPLALSTSTSLTLQIGEAIQSQGIREALCLWDQKKGGGWEK